MIILGDFNAFQWELMYSSVTWILSEYFTDPPLPLPRPTMTTQSPFFLIANSKGGLVPPPRLVFHPAVASTLGRKKAKGKKDGCCLTCFLFLFLSFNWKTQGAPSIPGYKL